MNLIIRKIDEPKDFLKIFELRIEVFIFEQNCPIEEEFDTYDNLNSDSVHFILEDNGECIGTARIVKYEKNKFKIQRVCIKKSKRKLSFGSKLMYDSCKITHFGWLKCVIFEFVDNSTV